MNVEETHVLEEPVDAPKESETAQEKADPKDALIELLTTERDQLKDQLLRALAESQNVQRRLRQQMVDERKFSVQPLVERLLPVLDSFERSLAAAEKGASFEALLDGVRVVDKQLRKALESAQVARIDSVGQEYDPNLHEAIASYETEDHPENTVTDEIEAGYTMHGRVVRPAKVRVAKKN